MLIIALQGASSPELTPPAAEPVVIQSECRDGKSGGGFVFEAILANRKWTNRITPLPGSDFLAGELFFAAPMFNVLPTPKGTRAVLNFGSVTVGEFRYSFSAISEMPKDNMENFSVDLSKTPLNAPTNTLFSMKTECKFVNQAPKTKADAK